MKVQPYVEKLYGSNEYKQFSKKYKDAFLVAGFFVLDLESGKNVHQIDFYLPTEKKFAAFSLDEAVNVQIVDTMGDKVPEKLNMETKIDLDALHGIIEDEMKNRNMTEEIKKIIAVIQNIKGKKIWNVNCVLSGMGILRAHIEDSSQSVLKMEKISFSEIMKKLPMDQLQAQQKAQQGGQGNQIVVEEDAEEKENPEEEMDKLNRLEEAIKKEKERLKEAVDKGKKTAKPAKIVEKDSKDYKKKSISKK
ncbi:MAG: hypothetical protein AABX83_00615 [Nanoarchaeota archaeon]